MKRCCWILIVFILLLAQLQPGTAAAGAPSNGQCGVGVFWSRSGDTLEITGSGFIASTEWPAGFAWSAFAEDIRTLCIEEGVRGIGQEAFENFSALETVHFPSTLVKIGTAAFSGCAGLRSLVLPAGLMEIAPFAFQGCVRLKEIRVAEGNTCFRSVDSVLLSKDGKQLLLYPAASVRETYAVPNGVEQIAPGAFRGAAALRTITFPDSLRELGAQTFLDCTGLERVSGPKHLHRIGDAAFEHCTSLSRADLSGCADGLAIGEFAFSRCSVLSEVRLPAVVTAMEQQAFEATPFLDRLRSTSGAAVYIGTVLYEATDISGSFSVRPGTTLAASYCFFGCDRLTEITMPESLKAIGSRAFYNCTGLTRLRLPQHALSIGREVFTNTPETLLEAENGMLYLGSHAIRSVGDDASALRPGTTDLAAFGMAWSEAASITLPNTVEILSECAFLGAAAEQIPIPASVREIGADAFSHSAITTCTVPAGVAVIPEQCFLACASLREIALPASVREIRANAFGRCDALTDVHYAANKDCSLMIERANDALLAAPRQHFGCTSIAAWTVKEQKPTLQAGGLTLHTCVCGYTYVDQETPPLQQRFRDVQQDAYYAPAVAWAVGRGVTNGMSETLFGPDAVCTRGQVVTFLWRAKGCPEPKRTANPFADVAAGAYYCKAVLWAVENGITDGASPTTFCPEAPCTRAHVVTFLWRAKGMPAARGSSPFADVPAGTYYTSAVIWAVSQGITDGTSDRAFSPDADCTRGQIVTFLFRAQQ